MTTPDRSSPVSARPRPRRRARGESGSGYFAPPLPRLIAHRGLATAAPENTLDAFRAAVEAGATHLETDVHLTGDGEVIVLHDADLTRVMGSSTALPPVSRSTLDEIRANAGPQLSVCTLIELLQTFPSARVNIDVKVAGAAEKTGRIVRELGAEGRVLLASFGGRRRRRALRSAPGAATSASALGTLVAVVAARAGSAVLLRVALRGVDAVQIPERVAGLRTTAAGTIARFHAAGVEVHIWTVNDPERMRALLDAGVDGIVTDRVDLLRQVVDERSL